MNEAPLEYEVKFSPIELEDMRQKLQGVGASLKTPERFNATMFVCLRGKS